MTQLHPALDTALAGHGATVFGALKITLPGATLRLVDGSAEIDLVEPGGPFTYRGKDPALGSWSAMEQFEDGAGDTAPGMTIRMLPASDEAAAELSDPLVQGSAVVVSIAARSELTGAVIGEPYPLLVGEIDVPVHRLGAGVLAVEYECVGGMERLFFNDEGIRLSQSFHEQVWPGELGFSHVTGITENDYWGVKGRTPSPMSGTFAGGAFGVDY